MAKTVKPNPKSENSSKKTITTRKSREKGLGRGLKALLGDGPALSALGGDMAATITQHAPDTNSILPEVKSDQVIAIEKIEPNPWQPRRQFLPAELKELASSVRQYGILQPLLVRPHPDKPDHYQLIAGERRWRAAQMAQLHLIPVVIRETDERQAAEMALIENIQRQDLNIIEEAEGYKRLLDEFDYRQEDLADMIGKSRSHLSNTMRLLSLPNKIRDMLLRSELTMGQVRPLIGHENAQELADIIKSRGLNARQAEELAAKGKQEKPFHKSEDPNLKATEQKLAEQLGLDIKLAFDNKTESGRIMITCRSLDQFDTIISRLID